jgi:hypothetical protein
MKNSSDRIERDFKHIEELLVHTRLLSATLRSVAVYFNDAAELLMADQAALDAKVAELKADVETYKQTTQATVDALTQHVADLQAQVDAGTAGADTQSTIDKIQSIIDEIVQNAPVPPTVPPVDPNAGGSTGSAGGSTGSPA